MNILSIFLLLGITFASFSPARAASSATIDFEGLAEGSIVSSLSSGNGISGDPISGSIAVFGFRPKLPGNQAMIFDSNCAGGCTGGDDDLHFNLGNILIVSEDGDGSDPNDSDAAGQYINFDFSAFGPGEVTVESLVIGDVEAEEAGGVVKIMGNGATLATVPIPVTGDGNTATLNIGVSGADFMVVDFAGSAAVDNINISIEEPSPPPPPPPPPGEEGCTPGYWKNHLDSWDDTPYSPSQTMEDVFNVPDVFNLDGKTLLQALSFQGGPYKPGAARILLRAATAAILNASHPDVAYPMDAADIISAVNTALLGSRADMLALKGILDANNNLGCPLD